MTSELVGAVPGVPTEPGRGEPGVPLLEVRDLQVSFRLERNTIYAVQGLSLQVRAGERVGVVGESGSGKSVSALSVMQMVPAPGRITGGEIIFEGRDLLGLSPAAMRHIRASSSPRIRTVASGPSSCSARWGSRSRRHACTSTRTA